MKKIDRLHQATGRFKQKLALKEAVLYENSRLQRLDSGDIYYAALSAANDFLPDNVSCSCFSSS